MNHTTATATDSLAVSVGPLVPLMSRPRAMLTQRTQSLQQDRSNSTSEVGRGCGSEMAFRALEAEVAGLHIMFASVIAQLEEQSGNAEQLPAYGQ